MLRAKKNRLGLSGKANERVLNLLLFSDSYRNLYDSAIGTFFGNVFFNQRPTCPVGSLYLSNRTKTIQNRYLYVVEMFFPVNYVLS